MSKRIIIASSNEIPAEIEQYLPTGSVILTSDLDDAKSDELLAKLIADVENANKAE